MNLGELQRSLKHLGPGQVLARYALRGMDRLFGFNECHGMCLTEESARAVAPVSGVEYRFVEPQRLRHEAKVSRSGLEPDDVERQIKAGEECFGAFIGEEVVSYIWFSKGAAHLRGKVFVHFDPAFAYSRWAYTREDQRGKHLHVLTKQRALKAFAARGLRGILSVVDAYNFPSLNAAAQAGCYRTGRMAMTANRVWTGASCRRQGLWLEIGPEAEQQFDRVVV